MHPFLMSFRDKVPDVHFEISNDNSNWIVSRSWDFFWLFSSLWLIPAAFVLNHHARWARVFLFSSLFLNFAHLTSPLCLACIFSKHVFRDRKKRIPKYFLLGTVIVGTLAAGIVGALQNYGVIPSHFRHGDALIFLGLTYLLWNTWHFGSQAFGILSLYRHRHPAKPRSYERHLDLAYIVFVFFMLMPVVWAASSTQGARLGPLRILGLPHLQMHGINQWVIGLSVVSTGGMLWNEFLLREIPSWSRVFYILSLGTLPIFGLLTGVFHYAVYTISHWLADIGLSSRIASRWIVREKRFHRLNPTIAFVLTALGLVAIGSVARLHCFFASWFPVCTEYVATTPLGSTSPANALWLGILIGVSFSLLFLHFYLSRRLYQFSDRHLRETILPLIVESRN